MRRIETWQPCILLMVYRWLKSRNHDAHVVSGVTKLPNSWQSRLILGFLWLTVIVILASYSGTLTSYLAVDIRRLPFTSLKHIAQYPSYKIWLDTESMLAELFRVSITVLYHDMIVWIWAGNFITYSIAAGLIRLVCPASSNIACNEAGRVLPNSPWL